MPDVSLILIYYIVFVYSTVCHEAAHAWVAYRLGDETAYRGGQVSFDPIPHMRREPMGMVVVPLLALITTKGLFGWASAPIDPYWAVSHPRRAAWVALAGPASNFLLCILSITAMYIGVRADVFGRPEFLHFHSLIGGKGNGAWDLVAQVLSVILMLNLLLGVLNMLPVPPLDGSNIPLLWMNPESAERYQTTIRQPQFQWITLLLIFFAFPRLMDPIRIWVIRHLYQILF